MPYHWNRRAVKEGHAVVKWVQTKFNISDMMTKPLEGHTFQTFLSFFCGYGSIKEHLEMLETCTRIHTEKSKWTLHNHEGVNRNFEMYWLVMSQLVISLIPLDRYWLEWQLIRLVHSAIEVYKPYSLPVTCLLIWMLNSLLLDNSYSTLKMTLRGIVPHTLAIVSALSWRPKIWLQLILGRHLAN